MHRLRATAFLARFVLAWFVLSLGVAVASPLVQPRGLQLVCGAGAVKLVPQSGEGDAQAVTLAMECALCSPAVVPPPAAASSAMLTRAPLPPLASLVNERDEQATLRPTARGPPQGQPG